MNENELFSLPRFLVMFRKSLFEMAKGMGLAMGIYVVIYLVLYIVRIGIENNSGVGENFNQEFFSSFLSIGGSIYASLAFSEIHNPQKRMLYLLLPASHFEKFITAWLLTFVLLFITWTIVFTSFSYVAMLVSHILFGVSISSFNIFDQNLTENLVSFYLIHTIFFTGSIFFKKFSYFKVIIALILISFTLIILVGITGKIISGITTGMLDFNYQIGILPNSYFDSPFWNGILIFLLILVPPVLWLSAYFRLTEQQSLQ